MSTTQNNDGKIVTSTDLATTNRCDCGTFVPGEPGQVVSCPGCQGAVYL